MHCIIPAHLLIGNKDNKSSRSVCHALRQAESHRLVVISVSQVQMILRGEKLFPIEPTPSMYKNPRGGQYQGDLLLAIPALSTAMPALSMAMPALSPVVGHDDWSLPALSPPALSTAMPALSPVVGHDDWSLPDLSPQALSMAMPALSPVVGHDDWSLPALSPQALSMAMPALSMAMPALSPVVGHDDWSLPALSLTLDAAEENNMDVEVVVPVESVATENDMELVPV